jgi:hypothetical protein
VSREGLIHILYPDDRWVTPEKVIGWARDLIADGDYEDVDLDAEDDPLPLAMELLSDTGEVTFAWCGMNESNDEGGYNIEHGIPGRVQ